MLFFRGLLGCGQNRESREEEPCLAGRQFAGVVDFCPYFREIQGSMQSVGMRKRGE